MSNYTWEELTQHDVLGPGETPAVPGEHRAGGIFDNPDDAFEYLSRGGLLQVIDTEGNVSVNPIVHIIKVEEEWGDEGFYQIWIAEDSGNAG